MSERTKGIIGIFLLVGFIIGGIQSCTHEHEWIEATCTEPRTCSSCNKTDGDPLGHDWLDATCTSPQTCRRCNITQGYRASHTWIPATCTDPESCSVCGKKQHWYSLPLGHDWKDATCTTPKTCSRCGATEGSPQHYFISYSWETTIEPTCQNPGEKSHACKHCGAVETSVIPPIAHKSSEWQIYQAATVSTPGIKVQCCEMCGIEMNRTEYSFSISVPTNNSGGVDNRTGTGNNFSTYNNTDQQNTTASYVLNTSTMKFHRPSCRDVPGISPGNYATSSQSRSELISRGYSACGHCSP